MSLLQIICVIGGCATSPPAPPPVDAGRLGRIGLVVGNGVPTYAIDGPEPDPAASGAAAALSGVLHCMNIIGPGTGPAALLVCLPVLAVATAAGSIASSMSVEAPDEAKRRAAEVVSSLQLHDAVRRAGLDHARAAGFDLQDLDPAAGPAGPDDMPDYAHLAGTLDSVLEINLLRLDPQVSFDAGVPVYFTLDAQLRLLTVPDMRVLDTWRLSRVTSTHDADYWLTDDGQRLRAELHRIASDIAVTALESLMEYRPARAAETVASRGERVPGYVLRPVSPPIRIENPFKGVFTEPVKEMLCGADYRGGTTYGWQEKAMLPSLQPEFRWEALPRAFDRRPGDGVGEIQDLRYDFRIFGKEGLVYERMGLVETVHVPESALAPCADYRWTVRARFRLDGVTRATEWTGAYDTIGGYVDPRWVHGRAGAPALAAIPDDLLEFFPIVETPAADGGTCKCR